VSVLCLIFIRFILLLILYSTFSNEDISEHCTFLDAGEDEDLDDELFNYFDSSDDDLDTRKLGDAFLSYWQVRVKKLEHDYAIAGWLLSVAHEVRDDVRNRATTVHRAAMERVVRKLHTAPCPNNSKWLKGKTMDQILDKFWEEELWFRKMEGPFKPSRFNSEPAVKGKSWVFHERYSLQETEVFGFVACRVTSKNLGIGACERSYGAMSRPSKLARGVC
jgi:hypothetical protein